MAKIFVIVVTYNPKRWLDKCFGSLGDSTLPLNTIVVDNCSHDGSQEIISSDYPEFELIRLQKNLGFGQANNIGIKKAYDAGADYVFLLNQDAWVEKDTLQNLVMAAEQNKEYGVISPIHLNGEGSALDLVFSMWIAPQYCPKLYSDVFMDQLEDNLYETSFVNAAAWLVSRRCIEIVGGFNPLFFMYGEDNNYLQRVAFHGFKTGIYPFARIYHDRLQKVNVFSTDKIETSIRRRLVMKYCNPNISDNIRQEKIWAFKGLIKALVKFDVNSIRISRKELVVLNKVSKDIVNSKVESVKTGLTFL